ncbi:MAG: carbamate kinase [Egibacteraceae bacterium]
MRTVVLAFGGNAFVGEGESGAYREQLATIQRMARVVVDLRERGYRVVITHGNGPQVGALAIQQEEGAGLVPPQPLFVLGAMTAGQLGHLLGLAIRGLVDRATSVTCLITHAVVDANDPAFQEPTKPIGPFFERDEAERLARERDWTVHEVEHSQHRRVVASPAPIEVLETGSIRTLLNEETLVIAGGGGGVPVVRCEGPRLEGVEVVIDKDPVARLLASVLGAELLILVTGVPAVAVNFDTADERWLQEVTVDEAEKLQQEGQFPAGSMGPKVESAVEFLHDGGELAIITSDEFVLAAVDGQHGTRIVPNGAAHDREGGA